MGVEIETQRGTLAEQIAWVAEQLERDNEIDPGWVDMGDMAATLRRILARFA